MNPLREFQIQQTRRQFFGDTGLRLGSVALAMMAQRQLQAADAVASAGVTSSATRMHPALPGLPHFAPKAKALIYLHMNGGPANWIPGITSPDYRSTSIKTCRIAFATAND